MESERSCCSRFRWCGIPVEIGCLIFSIFNAIIVGTSLVGCFVYIGWLIDIEINPGRHTHMDGLGLALNQLLCLILSICSGLSFIHAVILCYGAHKKMPPFVMIYFVYGIVVEFIVISLGIALLNMRAISYTHMLILILCVVAYAFILALVYQAYKAMSKNSLENEHEKLRNQYPVL